MSPRMDADTQEKNGRTARRSNREEVEDGYIIVVECRVFRDDQLSVIVICYLRSAVLLSLSISYTECSISVFCMREIEKIEGISFTNYVLDQTSKMM